MAVAKSELQRTSNPPVLEIILKNRWSRAKYTLKGHIHLAARELPYTSAKQKSVARVPHDGLKYVTAEKEQHETSGEIPITELEV